MPSSSPDRDDVTAVPGSFTTGRRRNNWTATVNPTVTDDSDSFYEEGSRWLNTVTRVIWTCTRATVGNALWTMGGVLDHGALTGLGDDDHTQYALMESQASDPGTPVRPEAFWYDTDAVAPLEEILDHITSEMDSTLVLAPDGVGGIEFRAETGGGGGGTHPNLATHDSMGLATDAELATHAATPHGYTAGAAGDLAQIDYGDAAAAGATGNVPDSGHQHPVNAKFAHASLTFEFGAGAAVNDYRLIPIPWDFTPVGYRIMGDVSGTAVFNLWMDVWSNGQPTSGDAVHGSAPPTCSGAIQVASTTLTGWDTTWVRGDALKVVLATLTTMTQVTLEIYGNKT